MPRKPEASVAPASDCFERLSTFKPVTSVVFRQPSRAVLCYRGLLSFRDCYLRTV